MNCYFEELVRYDRRDELVAWLLNHPSMKRLGLNREHIPRMGIRGLQQLAESLGYRDDSASPAVPPPADPRHNPDLDAAMGVQGSAVPPPVPPTSDPPPTHPSSPAGGPPTEPPHLPLHEELAAYLDQYKPPAKVPEPPVVPPHSGSVFDLGQSAKNLATSIGRAAWKAGDYATTALGKPAEAAAWMFDLPDRFEDTRLAGHLHNWSGNPEYAPPPLHREPRREVSYPHGIVGPLGPPKTLGESHAAGRPIMLSRAEVYAKALAEIPG